MMTTPLALEDRAPALSVPTLHGLFEARVDVAPERTACSLGGDWLTYGDLEQKANQLAHRLRRLGVGPDRRVAIHLERSPEMVVAIVAVLKAGGAYVPLDPEHPAERRRFMVEDSRSVVLVSREKLWEGEIAPPAASFVCLDAEAAGLAEEPSWRPPAVNGPDDLAYVIYTSGSTGVPKGVMVTHHNVTRLLSATQPWFGFGPDDVWTLFHSFAFDFSVWEMWGALAYGGRVVVVPFGTTRTPSEMAELLIRDGVTVLNQTPSAFRSLAPAILARDDTLPLRYVVFGGEALDFRLLGPWFKRFGDQRPRLVNMYGITETTVHVTYRPVSAVDVTLGTSSLIGVPIPDLEVTVVDDDLVPVGDGEIGEIVVGGAGVARGYLNRPELTAERFVERDGRRLYRSGDLARRLANGDLEYLGRADHQVKLRGFRIETSEVEARLLDGGELTDAVVRLVGAADRARLVAWCVPRTGERLDRSALRQRLARSLPDYMIPAALVALQQLPLTVNGKLDVDALPLPELDAAPYRPPETDTEALLARLWADVLDGVDVGRDDNFVALGGQSIDAGRVLRGLQSERSVTLSYRQFFDAPTLADLAAVVDAHHVERGDGSIAQGPPAPAGAVTVAEEQFALLARLAPDVPLHAESLALRISGSFEINRLRHALQELMARHAALRSTYSDDDGVVRRGMIEPSSLCFEHHDLRRHRASGRAAEFARQAVARLRQGFDLSRGPLWRVDVYTLGETEHRALFSFHHIVLDGVACGLVVAELGALYRGEPLPAVAYDVEAAAGDQRRRLAATVTRHLPYWRARLDNLGVLDFPTDHPRPVVRSFRGARLRRCLPAELVGRLRAVARQAGATVFTTLLAGFEVLLWGHSGQEEVVLGTISAGRSRPETEGVVGCLVNALVLRQTIDRGQPFSELVTSVRDGLLDAQAHDELPFPSLVSELGVGGDPGRNPLFQVSFSAVVPIPDPLPGWSVEVSPVDPGTARFDLAVQVAETAGGVEVCFEYSTDLFEPVTVARLADRYVELLGAVAEDAYQRVGSIPLVGRREVATLAAWADGGAAPAGPLVLERIRRHVINTPDALAAVHGEESLTYWELDRQSDNVAERLADLGVGIETIVGLATPPSLAWLVGMLGILKAGAAFLPLDPEYPRARLQGMLEDARVPVLCTVPESAGAFAGFPGRFLDLSAGCDPGVLRPSPPLHRHSLAYVIYTSGSTGRPKGAMVEHGGLDNMVESYVRLTGLTAVDRVAQFASPSFDACIFEAFGTLSVGAQLIIAPPEARLPGAEKIAFLGRHAITVMFSPPAGLVALPSAELPSVRVMIPAGEALPAEVVDRWGPGRLVLNMYGPTECTVFSTMAACQPGERKPPIGRPIGGVRVYVVDEMMRRCPIGVPGELLIGGAGVGRGYLRREDLTTERFRPDPFTRDGGLVYRTGDLVRFRPDGQLEFLSRLDRQVKLRGFRIELGEIETALLSHPAISQAVATVRHDHPGDQRLVAYLVTSQPVDPHQLRAFLAQTLPRFMIPAAFVAVPAIPVSPNGKIDHQALPPPPPATPTGPARPPTDRLHRDLQAIWSDVLTTTAIGLDDAFFDLGGDSLALTRIQALIRTRLATDIPMIELLQRPTIRSLAEHLRLSDTPGTEERCLR